MPDYLETQLIAELTAPVDSGVSDFIQNFVKKLAKPPLGIVFYGSVLRQSDPEGIMDFYVITDHAHDYPGGILARLGNIILPPNVCYAEDREVEKPLRAKIAFISYGQLLRRCRLESGDTTIWARFSQPVRLVWVRDSHSADDILNALRCAIVTASCWAALLGPDSGRPEDYWHGLFSLTYRAELRVERSGRSRNLLAGQEERYADCLLASWQQAGITAPCTEKNLYHPVLSHSAREKAHRRWKRMACWGKILNIARLLKAAFTFSDGVHYLIWKIKRHTGQDIKLTKFEQTHPVLSLPLLLWHLRKTRRQ